MRKRSVLREEETLVETLVGAPVQGARRLRQATKTGACLTAQMSMVDGTELGAQEWRDALFLQYVLDPPELPQYCDGCYANFYICHALDCKRANLSRRFTTIFVTGLRI